MVASKGAARWSRHPAAWPLHTERLARRSTRKKVDVRLRAIQELLGQAVMVHIVVMPQVLAEPARCCIALHGKHGLHPAQQAEDFQGMQFRTPAAAGASHAYLWRRSVALAWASEGGHGNGGWGQQGACQSARMSSTALAAPACSRQAW